MKIVQVISIVFITLVMSACGDVPPLHHEEFKHKITMYGCDGKVISKWESIGNVRSDGSGWYFEESTSHKLIELTGVLVIEQE